MARNIDNCITHGSSGKLGHVVFTSDGKIRSRPDVSGRVWSAGQKAQLNRFEKAKEFARRVTSDPELNGIYAEKAASLYGLGAWHLAIRDYFDPPHIWDIRLPEFCGRAENEIIIRVHDKILVAEVNVSIMSHKGELLEEGTAMQTLYKEYLIYRLGRDCDLVPGLTITIRAMDIPGNIDTVKLEWPFECEDAFNTNRMERRVPAKKRLKSQLRVR